MVLTATIVSQTPIAEQLKDNKDLPDPIGMMPHEFIKALFGKMTDGFIEVTYLAPDGIKIYPHTVVNWAALPIGDIDPELPHIKDMNLRGYSCYFGCAVRGKKYEPETRVNEKNGRPYLFYPRGKAVDSSYLTALWIDIDEPGIEGYQRAMQMQPPASIIVSSGGGYHAYWLLSKPIKVTDDNRAMIKQTLKGMALACGSDTSVADLARIMRLPGTINTKPDRGTFCEVIDYIPCYYDYQDFELRYSPLAAPRTPEIQRSIPSSASAGMPRWVSDYLDSGASQGERNKTAFRAACRLFDNGFSYTDVERMIGNRAMRDGLDDNEVSTLIRSASNSDRKAPNMPRHMQERMATADHVIRERN